MPTTISRQRPFPPTGALITLLHEATHIVDYVNRYAPYKAGLFIDISQLATSWCWAGGGGWQPRCDRG